MKQRTHSTPGLGASEQSANAVPGKSRQRLVAIGIRLRCRAGAGRKGPRLGVVRECGILGGDGYVIVLPESR